jgi:hypothetical protein
MATAYETAIAREVAVRSRAAHLYRLLRDMLQEVGPLAT